MVGETWENWEECVQRTISMAPDSVTIYQMELPFNTVYSKDVLGKQVETPVADWPLKRAWVEFAFQELENAGYVVSSAYTMVRDREKVRFRYRDHVWQGSDLLASGVASFGHISGVHYQNATEWQDYVDALERGELPLVRALTITKQQALIRELILQLKRGYLDVGAFQAKFDVDILKEWQSEWHQLREEGFVELGPQIELTRAGLLCVDALLPRFFEPAYRTVRYS